MYPLTISGTIHQEDEPNGTRLADLCNRHGLTTQAETLRNVCVSAATSDPLGTVVPAANVPNPAVPRDMANTQLMPTISA